MSRVHHVWVRLADSPDDLPGLVLGWRQDPDWEAQVIYVEPSGRVVTEWLPKDRLRPIESTPTIGSQYG